MSEHRYVMADAIHETERDRLRALESWADPFTVSHLTTIGVAPGWRCLEVGAGAGSVARWLADRVGATGMVVASDIDTLRPVPSTACSPRRCLAAGWLLKSRTSAS